jgi:uncharacterized protein YcsI (UPF0317 family)
MGPAGRRPERTGPAGGAEVRERIRKGLITGQTSGMAPGYVQANLVILPSSWAAEFLAFCQANPKPCPILAVGERGSPRLPSLGAEIDVRADLPAYRLYRHGRLDEELHDITKYWSQDFVSFAIGCSFSFETALLRAGLPVRHIEEGVNVPMFRTNIDCEPAGRFSGKLVVSMRPFAPSAAALAREITRRAPQIHGAPVHAGAPEEIGVTDLGRPDFGDPVTVRAGEIAVFWACGVTPQVALVEAKPPVAITHSPGCMLITDVTDDDLLNGRFFAETSAILL